MSSPYAEKPWIKRYDEGIPATIDIPDYPLFHFLEESASKYPEHTAIIFKGRRISYRQLNELTDAIAAGLAANGFKKGDRAVIYMPNVPQFVISYFGILKAGGIAIATNPLYTERELEHQLADCGAETVFVMSLYYKQLKTVQRKGHTKVKRVIVTNVKEYFPPHLNVLFTLLKEKKEGHAAELEPGDMTFQDFLAMGKRAPKPNVTVTGNDIALLQYTGGTTGLAKGAIGLHRSLVANTLSLQTWIDWEYGKEGFLAAIPFFHVYGMVTAMIFAISIAGTQIIIVNPRDQKDLLSSINKYQPAIFPGVPALYNAININPDVAAGKYNIRSIRACISGSAPLLIETKRKFEELTGGTLVEGFGMTETFVATHANPIQGENREGSIGLPIPNVECRIVNVEDGVTDMPVGESGELIIKGPTVMQGYWQMPTETANALRDGWLYSGDIAKMDDQGYFYITDRKKDMIIAGGYNIYP
ncbi:MAG: AMP-binding protein, partial [Anaerolineales bacterium]|nr:AMP-binding protein [Anaerolineales bacterium]